MKRNKVAFYDAHPYDITSFNSVNKDFNFDISYFKERLAVKTAILSRNHDVVCIFVNDIINSEVVNILLENNIGLIALRCAGYNNIDLKAVFKKIHVVRVPEYSPYAVAEHAVALMLSLNRKTHRAFYRTRDNNFNINGLLGFDMKGKTAGVIGTGKIGKVLTGILKGFGMRVLAFDPYPDREYSEQVGFEYVNIDEIYSECDIISLNCPLTKETFHLINGESIKKMKDGVMIINTGRGQLVDTISLIKALKKNKIGAAGLDVYEEESKYFFEDFSSIIIDDDILERLLTFPNVLITSHQGFFTKEALNNIALTTLKNIRDFFEKNAVKNEICYHCDRGYCNRKKEGFCWNVSHCEQSLKGKA